MPEVAALFANMYHPYRRRTRPGARPGLILTDPAAPQPEIQVIGYGPDEFAEHEISKPAELTELIGRLPVTWVNVNGLGDADTIKQLGKIFNLHPLALEDVVHVHQRSKVEEYDDVLFIVARMVSIGGEDLTTEQITLFLGKNFVLTFQERPGDCLNPVRERLRKGQGRIRRAGTDYLAYSLLDAVIDGYFPTIEELGNRLEMLDDEITEKPRPEFVGKIHQVRSDLLVLRKSAWPHREAVNMLVRDPFALISDDTRVYLRDCYDHTVQIIDVVESYREMCSDLRDFYLSAVSNRANEIMKVLTVIATIFIPLSFIASVYGMNFDPESSPWNMPELRWTFGYPFALGIMVVFAAGLLGFFWRRGWLGR